MTVDTRYTSIRNILQYVDGSRWIVRYYSQVLGADTELSPQQPNLSPVYQQYRRIDKFHIAVSSALDLQQDQVTKQFAATGSGTTLPGLIPNKGDMFLADIGDGREALFVVTEAARMTHLNESLYSIDFELVDYAGRDSERYQDIEEKVIQELVFVRDHVSVGERPIITQVEYVQREDLIQVRKDLISLYFHDFFSHEHSMILLPGQQQRTYDPFVARYLVDLVSMDEHPLTSRIKFPAVGSIPGMRQDTVWTALRQLTAPLVERVVRRCALVPTAHWRGQVQYGGLYYSGAKYVVYPIDPRADVDAPHDERVLGASGALPIQNAGVRRGDMVAFLDQFQALVPPLDLAGINELPNIVGVLYDDCYVFTEAFYKNKGPFTTQLERLTNQMLNHHPIEKAVLLSIAKDAVNWPDLERFYYIPVLLTLLKVSIQTS